jgi:hypothetical protein
MLSNDADRATIKVNLAPGTSGHGVTTTALAKGQKRAASGGK